MLDESDPIFKRAKLLIDQLGEDEAINQLAKMFGYREMPVTVDQFLDDPYFFGNNTGWDCPNGWGTGVYTGKGVYPYIREMLRKIFPHPLYSKYIEVAATGAIGIGKTFICVIGMAYDLHRLQCLNSPHELFQLDKSEPIVLAFLNATMDLAEETAFEKFTNLTANSEYFKSLKLAAGDKRYIAPHNTTVFTGSRGNQVLGKGVVGCTFSEVNFLGEHKKTQASDQFEQVSTRMYSRYARGKGMMMPGRLWSDSSRNTQDGYLEQRLKTLDPENAIIIAKPQWEVRAEIGKEEYSGQKFPIFKGNDLKRDPQIIEDVTVLKDIPGLRDTDIIYVPVELKPAAQRDLYRFLRDQAGVALWSNKRAMPYDDLILAALTLKAPYKQFVEPTFYMDLDPAQQIIDFIDIDMIPKDRVYYLHFDVSKSGDATGIGMTCAVAPIQVERVDKHLIAKVTRDLMYETPLVCCIKAKPGARVPQTKLRRFVTDLVHAGFRIGGVSADQYQSEALLQFAQEIGIPDLLLSVDRPRDRYDNLFDAIMEERWLAPNHPVLLREIRELQDNGDKIDHPLNENLHNREPYSKDVADGCAGSMWNCKINSTWMLTAASTYVRERRERRNAMDLEQTARSMVDAKSNSEMQNALFGQTTPDPNIEEILGAILSRKEKKEMEGKQRQFVTREERQVQQMTPQQLIAYQVKAQVEAFKNMTKRRR